MENENPMDKRGLTVEKRLFLALQKEKGVLYPQIISQFSEKWPNINVVGCLFIGFFDQGFMLIAKIYYA